MSYHYGEDFYSVVAKERLERMRAEAERAALFREARPPKRALRMALGKALMATGRWVLGPVPDWTDDVRRVAPAVGRAAQRAR